jgi:hypothetical protein
MTWRRPRPLQEGEITVVERRGNEPDQHIARPWFRLQHLGHRHGIGPDRRRDLGG